MSYPSQGRSRWIDLRLAEEHTREPLTVIVQKTCPLVSTLATDELSITMYLFFRFRKVFGAPDIAFSARQRPPACCRGRSAWRLAAPWPVVAVLAAGDLPLTHNLMPAAVNAVLAALERREQRVSRGHSRGL